MINKKRGVTPSTALRLAKFFGVSEEFWINLQIRWDLYKAKQAESQELKTIKPIRSYRTPQVSALKDKV